MTTRLPLLALLTLALFGQSAPMDEVLARGRDRILNTIDHLTHYTCTQTVDRSEFYPTEPNLPHGSCEQILLNRRNGISQMALAVSDRLRLEVEVTEGGLELFSWPGASRLASERVQEFSGEGIIGTGAFGPFLINIFTTPGVRFWPEETVSVEGHNMRQYRYMVPLASSRHGVASGSGTRVVPFEGRFWLDPDTAELRRLLVRTAELSRSTGSCEASTTVDFTQSHIGSGEYLRPDKSLLHVVRRDSVELENATVYASCHEFQGESAIHFGDVVEGAGSGPTPAPSDRFATVRGKTTVKSFPPGVPVAILVESEIDTATAAAGDLIAAQVRHADPQPKKRLLPETGVPARCRLTTVRRLLGGYPQFVISLACDAIRLNGEWIPFAAKRDKPADLLQRQLISYMSNGLEYGVKTQGRRPPERGGTFIFPTGAPRFLTWPFPSKWTTVVPEDAAARR